MKKLLFIFLISLTFILFECQNRLDKANIEEPITDSYYVSKAMAIKYAHFLVDNPISQNARGITRNIKDVSEIKDSVSNLTALYVINYEDSGWVILSADKRIYPLLAHSEKSTFSINNIPPAVLIWIDDKVKFISKIRNGEINISETFENEWDYQNSDRYFSIKDIENGNSAKAM